MKFDVFKWQEVKPNETYESEKGRVCVMCSESCNVYVEAQGVEVLAGFGQSVKVETREPVRFRVEASEGARVFVENPPDRSIKHVGEVFTNIDRMPSESGNLLEVKRAMRQFQLEQATALKEMREHRRALAKREQAASVEREQAEAARAAEPETEPEPDGGDDADQS